MAKKFPTITTPVGIATWVCVQKPSTKFNPDGDYSITAVFEEDAIADLKAKLEAAAEAARKDAISKDPKQAGKIKNYTLNTGLSAEVDDDGEETGRIVFKAKAKAKITPKNGEPFEKRVGLFDAKGKPITTQVRIGKGSKVRVAFEMVPFCMAATKTVGVSVRLAAVQLIELVEYVAGGNADSFGFGEEEGYSFDDADTGSTGADAPEGGEGENPEGDDSNGDF